MASKEVEVFIDCASDRSSENSEEISKTSHWWNWNQQHFVTQVLLRCVELFYQVYINGKKALCQLYDNEYVYHGNLWDHLQLYHKSKYKPNVVFSQNNVDSFISHPKCLPKQATHRINCIYGSQRFVTCCYYGSWRFQMIIILPETWVYISVGSPCGGYFKV